MDQSSLLKEVASLTPDQASTKHAGRTPLLPDIGIVGFVPEAWDEVGVWMPRHHVLTRLAKYFHVLWAEPAKEWREHWLGQRPAREQLNGKEDFPPGFIRYRSEKWLPKFYRPALLGAVTAAKRVHRAEAILRQQGCKKIVFYLWRPEFAHVLDVASCDLSCYHIDDEYSFSASDQPLDNAEVQLIKRVDEVFIHSPALLERKGQFNSHTRYITNGVDYASFAAPHAEPLDMKEIPHPRLGYIGTIKTHLDLQLLYDLACRHPEWSLVMVGPRGYMGTDAQLEKKLAAFRNVYYLGSKSVDSVCAYPQHMDVCLLPYKVNDYTKYIYPLKLHEYLASGKPVVGSPIRSLESFGHVIGLAKTVDEWSAEIDAALSPQASAPHIVEQRRTVAREYDWNALVSKIAQTICERLGPATAKRFNEYEK